MRRVNRVVLIIFIAIYIILGYDSPRSSGKCLASPAPRNAEKNIYRTLTPSIDYPASSIWINPKDKMKFVYVPAGDFPLGLSKRDITNLLREYPKVPKDVTDSFTFEQPQCRIFLKGFWIGVTEVTNSQYMLFVKATKHSFPKYWQGGKIPKGLENFPVVDVNWTDADAYSKWAEVRLPTELEWEKAARGTDGRIFPWGNEWDVNKCRNFLLVAGDKNTSRQGGEVAYDKWATFHDRYKEGPTPVGSYPLDKSPYGCLDMSGNVREWCDGWHENNIYKKFAKSDFRSNGIGKHRILRGCAWDNYQPWQFRLTARNYNPLPIYAFSDSGFRCAFDK
jgi:formylglycine-generating enzyme required for sulfatase activity